MPSSDSSARSRGAWPARLLVVAIWPIAWSLIQATRTAWADVTSPPLMVETAIALAVTAVGATVAVYLALTSIPLLVASLPHSRLTAGWATRITPAVWRKIVSAAVGGTLAASMATASFAASVDEPPPAVAAVTSAGWVDTPSTATSQPTPHPSASARPSPTAPHDAPGPPPETPTATAPSQGTPLPQPDTVKVRRGDSLWVICAGLLPATATESDIARAWPLLYRANVGVIGDNPSLIYAGQTLEVPAELTS
ncbi:LysM peptidoglycan-binding domain-containing protein [Demequina aurantiaca]|uniref:LysM peptidoglycan-binding domain-containing protein n=1 Tax=Demequina aurantiaca TaxID=676200 RepID=UPI003D32EBD2